MTSVFRKLLSRKVRVETPEDLHRFLAAQAAFVAQKSSVEYCRAKAGLNWNKLFKEAPFQAALDVCRWECYAAVLADMTLVVEGVLRPQVVGAESELAQGLLMLHRKILLDGPQPQHRSAGWEDVLGELPGRLAAAQLAAPQPLERIVAVGGQRVFAALPIHPDLRREDREMVVNSVRFLMIAFRDRLCREIDAPSLARAIVLTVHT